MSVRLDRRVFRQLGRDEESWNQTVVVAGCPVDVALEALAAAATRFMRVSRGGREIDDDPDGRAHTPSFASARQREDGLPELTVDCDSVVGQRRSSAFRRIVKEELTRLGVTDAEVVPAPEEVERVAEADETPPVPAWVRFAYSDPPGMPPGVLPALGQVVDLGASDTYVTTFDGVEHRGSWVAWITSVTDDHHESCFEAVANHFATLGPTERFSGTGEFDEVPKLGATTTIDGYDVEAIVRPLRGLRAKPRYLQGRKEATVVSVRVFQRPPDEWSDQ